MNKGILASAHEFLKANLFATKMNEIDIMYRYEHSLRVYHLAELLTEKEGYDEPVLLLSCLLHDVGKFASPSEKEHGRVSAQIARPFLETLALSKQQIKAICDSIAMHVDGVGTVDEAFQREADALIDCDNLDRMSAYRMGESLLYDLTQFGCLSKMEEHLELKIKHITSYQENKIGSSETANRLFDELFECQQTFYKLLLKQVKTSHFE